MENSMEKIENKSNHKYTIMLDLYSYDDEE